MENRTYSQEDTKNNNERESVLKATTEPTKCGLCFTNDLTKQKSTSVKEIHKSITTRKMGFQVTQKMMKQLSHHVNKRHVSK